MIGLVHGVIHVPWVATRLAPAGDSGIWSSAGCGVAERVLAGVGGF